MLKAPLTAVQMLATLLWTGAVVTAYFWLMLYKPFRDGALTITERRIQIALLVVLTGLVLYVDLAYPAGWFWLFINVQ